MLRMWTLAPRLRPTFAEAQGDLIVHSLPDAAVLVQVAFVVSAATVVPPLTAYRLFRRPRWRRGRGGCHAGGSRIRTRSACRCGRWGLGASCWMPGNVLVV
jgi:hypothetical protein